MTLFNHYMAVDWSASNTPKRGKDSIWMARCSVRNEVTPINIRTRAEAYQTLYDFIHKTLAERQRVIIGFDFAFGYPAGTAQALGGQNWQDIWYLIHDKIEDHSNNKSNRFEVAAQLNKVMGGEEGPFWGHPHQQSFDGLNPKKPLAFQSNISEFRFVETRATSAKSVWQLAYNGAVGSQTLLGIAMLERLRRDPIIGEHIAIWPFETNFAEALHKPILFAEIYPSSHKDWKDLPYDTPDAKQVTKVAKDFRTWDVNGTLSSKLSAYELPPSQHDNILHEEGWIVGQ